MDAQTQVYLLRVTADEEGGVRIELREATGKTRYFAELEAMLAYLRARCHEPDASSAPGEA